MTVAEPGALRTQSCTPAAAWGGVTLQVVVQMMYVLLVVTAAMEPLETVVVTAGSIVAGSVVTVVPTEWPDPLAAKTIMACAEGNALGRSNHPAVPEALTAPCQPVAFVGGAFVVTCHGNASEFGCTPSLVIVIDPPAGTRISEPSPSVTSCPVSVPPAKGRSRVALFDTQLVQVPVRLVMTPDAGVPRAGVTKVRFVALNPLGRVVLSEGTPPLLVLRTALFTAEM